MANDKIELLQLELLKQNPRKEVNELRSELALCKERLQQYMVIEEEMDNAINNSDASGFRAPTSVQRRIQQSIELAKKLRDKEVQCTALFEENKRIKLELEDASEQLSIIRRVDSNRDQPQDHLAKLLEAKENQLADSRNKIEQLQTRCEEYSCQQDILVNRNKMLRDDLQQLVAKRETIENFKDGFLGDGPPKSVPAWFGRLQKKMGD